MTSFPAFVLGIFHCPHPRRQILCVNCEKSAPKRTEMNIIKKLMHLKLKRPCGYHITMSSLTIRCHIIANDKLIMG
jgi:hypothetical protein